MGGLARPFPTHTPDVVPDGGQFLAAPYSNQAGSRDYKLYIPSGYRGQAVPLVVMLHGCTQSPDDFAAGTRMNVSRRGAHLPSRLSCPGRVGECLEVLELVQPVRPAAWPRRTLSDRGDHAANHARLFGRSRPRLYRRTVGRCRGCRHHGNDLPRSLRRHRRAFRAWPAEPPATFPRRSPP